MDTTKPTRTALSIWPSTLLRINRLKGDVAEQRGQLVDLDTLLNELIDHYRATAPKPAVRRPSTHSVSRA